MGLDTSAIADLVATTLKELGRLKWTDISLSLQEYVVLPQLLKKERVVEDSGLEIQFNVRHDITSLARAVGLYETDQVNIGGQMTTGAVPWRHLTTNYGFEEHEVAMNSGAAKIVDLVKTRRTEMLMGLAEKLESVFWGKPATSADVVTPFGVEYWIVPHATEGFYGGDPAGFTLGAAGLATATYARWKNYTARYVAISKSDFVTKLRKAAVMTNFKSPIELPQYAGAIRRGFYTNYTVLAALESLLEDQNDNLGNDIASKDGLTTFRRIPVQFVPALETSGYNSVYDKQPVYGIDWESFKIAFLKGWYMKEKPPMQDPNRHNTTVVHVDATLNTICKDRRRQIYLGIA